jgi:DNA mismatch repair protein MutS
METKALCPDSFLFFQVGDFFEMFFDDAVEASRLLDLTLTSRQKIDGVPVPMCGVPLAAGELYFNRLAAMGHKVSVCEQESLPAPGEKVAKRRLSRIITPGTILSSEEDGPGGTLLCLVSPRSVTADPPPPSLGAAETRSPKPSPPLNPPTAPAPPAGAGKAPAGGIFHLSAVDISTGDFSLFRFDDLQDLLSELQRLEPGELLCLGEPPEELSSLAEKRRVLLGRVDPAPDPRLEILSVFGDDPEDGGEALYEDAGALLNAGTLIRRLKELTPGAGLAHLNFPRLLWTRPHMGLDETAARNLELFRSLSRGGPEGSLFQILDESATPMGSRLLKKWLLFPLTDGGKVSERHDAVDELVRKSLLRDSLRDILKQTRDLERALARLSLKRGTLKDLQSLRQACRLAPRLADALKEAESALLRSLVPPLFAAGGISGELDRALLDPGDLPAGSPEGAFIKSGFSPKLDEHRDMESGGRRRISEIEARERERTGISRLKVGYTRVFGYYLEVSRGQIQNVPESWRRKQTLANCERYATPELSEWEESVLNSRESREELENRILQNLKNRILKSAPAARALSGALAALDALASFSLVSQKNGWTRPVITRDDLIDIKGGRHPVVEAFLAKGESFVENDVRLSGKERLLIITGPNMSGKSTILRQTALIVILCQTGCFVPAKSARLSMRDQVFTRVGASDDLSRGRSTFMTEMSETARILKKATPKSLVILDEVGRGTSTYDGVAIAWAVAEYLHDLQGRGVPTLFATHYHELVELPRFKPLAVNYNVQVMKWEGRVIFLRKLVPGGTSRSYGVAVAALAGLPRRVVTRATMVLKDLTRGNQARVRPDQTPRELFSDSNPDQDALKPGLSRDRGTPDEEKSPSAELREALRLVKELSEIKPDTISPMEALRLLSLYAERAGGLGL